MVRHRQWPSYFILTREAFTWHPLNFGLALLLVTCLIAGCSSTPSKQLYENPKSGVRLEKPENWDLAFYERGGFIVLEAKKGIWDKESARVEIHGSACGHTLSITPEEHIKANIGRIRTLYSLDSVPIVQEPAKIEAGDYEVTKAVIAIPTTSLKADAVENQIGDHGPDIFQPIEMFEIRDSNVNFIMAYVYKGNSESLNAQAQEIINSIQLTCSADS